MTCYDIRYDGLRVNFFDHNLKSFSECPCKVYITNEKGAKKLFGEIQASGGIENCHTKFIQLRTGEWLVYNPKQTQPDGFTLARQCGWFAMKSALEEKSIKLNTNWNMIPVLDLNNLSQRQPDDVFLVSSEKLENFEEIHQTSIVVPLLETLICIRQKFHGMSLKQISSDVFGYFKAEYYDEKKLMIDLFNQFRSELIEICQNEAVPIQHLYQCEFNNTFRYLSHECSPGEITESVKRLVNVYMVPQSLLVGDGKKDYGNIPWKIASHKDTKEVASRSKISYPCEPFLYFETDTFKEKGQFLSDVIIFPQMTIEGQTYPANSSMAFRVIPGTKSSELIFRGDLFKTITAMEWIIINELYKALRRGDFNESDDTAIIYRNLPLPSNELKVRKSFIDAIKRAMSASR